MEGRLRRKVKPSTERKPRLTDTQPRLIELSVKYKREEGALKLVASPLHILPPATLGAEATKHSNHIRVSLTGGGEKRKNKKPFVESSSDKQLHTIQSKDEEVKFLSHVKEETVIEVALSSTASTVHPTRV